MDLQKNSIDKIDSIIPLYGYQKRWIEDDSPFRICNKARQIGISWAVGLDIVLDILENRSTWLYLSAKQDLAREFLKYKVGPHIKTLNVIAEITEHIEVIDEKDITVYEVNFPNDGRIKAMVASPHTARSITAQGVVLDEFAHFEDSENVYTAIVPSLTRGGRLYIISTPCGTNNKFYRLWHENDIFKKFHITLDEAIAEGLPESTKKIAFDLIKDPDRRKQEYYCEFLEDNSRFLPLALVQAAESIFSKMNTPLEQLKGKKLYVGWDVARHEHKSVIWVNELMKDGWNAVHVETMINEKWKDMKDKFHGIMSCGVICAAIDGSGLGDQLSEEMSDLYGEGKIKIIKFTNPKKHSMATALKENLENGKQRIPFDINIRYALTSVERSVIGEDAFKYTVGEGVGADDSAVEKGHADEFWALALAIRAGSLPAITYTSEVLRKSRITEFRGYY